MRRYWKTVPLVALLAFTLSACGEPTPTQTTETNAVSTQDPSATQTPTTTQTPTVKATSTCRGTSPVKPMTVTLEDIGDSLRVTWDSANVVYDPTDTSEMNSTVWMVTVMNENGDDKDLLGVHSASGKVAQFVTRDDTLERYDVAVNATSKGSAVSATFPWKDIRAKGSIQWSAVLGAGGSDVDQCPAQDASKPILKRS